ncbi:GNAT family N-acetyltransferase [Microbacterium sp. Clip185]|uniref:GNAT family N-acetyltransferase n=1 Tax=Microbacterium sp. Clip185 TaxID=3025663 RepID=UPI002365F753|nr:GNAT family N-acetyltransferase [Microbacterium sp. Clip185]WDG19275.1 GNAT family N-acetyltransferase [Microbacterium sp. Clip185]
MTVLIRPAAASDHPRLVEVWRSAVEATHDFLTSAEVDLYEQQLREYLPQMPVLWVAVDDDTAIGFLGSGDGVIEMLFVDPTRHGRGIGRALVARVAGGAAPLRVDVNEENAGAQRFYAALGFIEVGRSALDGEGQPHPILHLERPLG